MANQLIQLKDGSNNLFPNVFVGLDSNNILAEEMFTDSNREYLASQDCLAMLTRSDGQMKFNNNSLIFQENYWSGYPSFCMPLKQGQKISMANAGGNLGCYKIYGLKY